MHHRLVPQSRRFEYGIFLLWVDLDELDALHASLRLFSRNRRNVYEFRDWDHLEFPGPGVHADLKSSVRAWVMAHGIAVPEDFRVALLALPRVAGYVFNPVSFYFLSTAEGKPLGAVAQVSNTFGEMKPYWVPLEASTESDEDHFNATQLTGNATRFRRVVPKHFYVSPFTALDVCFDFRLRRPEERLALSVNDVTTAGETLLRSTLTGERRPLTDRELLRLSFKYPLVTLHVMGAIHWQALKLWWRGLPWHKKSARPELQRELYRPHHSLQGLPTTTPAPAHQPIL